MPFPRPLLALAAGVLATLGFAPWGLWPLTIIGTAALVALVDTAPSRRGAALRGWLFGTGHFALGLTWIAHAFTYQDKMPPVLGWVAVVGLAMFLALYVGLAAGLAHGLARTPLARVAMLSASFMLGEWLRGWVLTGFAWNPLGAAWLDAPGVGQMAAFGGSLALSGLMMLTGGALWLLVRPGGDRTGRIAGVGIGLGIVAAGVIGAGRIGPRADPAGPVVILVQPNISQDEKYRSDSQESNVRRYLDLTAQALATRTSSQPAIILWSEGAVPWLVEEEAGVRAGLAAVLGPRDLLAFGGTAAVRDPAGALTALGNSLFVLDSRGAIVGRYDKQHLVPLGEYVPARPLMTAIGLARLVPGSLEFRPGPGPRTLDLAGFPAAGIQICYEIIFPGAVVDRRRRPAWIINVSNDAWYGASGPPQHLAQARLRAIEEGLAIARATPTGVSAMIDPHGRVTAQVAQGLAGFAATSLPPALPPTLFARAGNTAPAVFGALLLLAGLVADRARRRLPSPSGVPHPGI